MGTKPLRLRSMWVIFIFRLLYFFSECPCLRLLDLLGCFLSLIAMDHLSLEHLFLEGLQDFVGVDLDSRTDTLYFSAIVLITGSARISAPRRNRLVAWTCS